MNTTTKKPYNLTEALAQSLQEVKLMREGKLPKRSWKAFANKMRNEIANGNKQ
jgi:hypothetical protein